MADRYHDRPFPAGNAYDRRDDQHAAARAESDPLAELARLIGQTDPFASMGRANLTPQPRAEVHDHYDEPEEPEQLQDDPRAGPPPWMQRVARQEAPQQDYPSSVHPLQRYAAQHVAPDPDDQEASYADDDQEAEPSRYDDALYGEYDPGAEPAQPDRAFANDPYGYHPGYAEEAPEPAPRRRGGIATVAAVLALAVVGTGAAFAYRTYVGTPRNGGEPPIIKADTSPTKVVPAAAEAAAKVPDRLASSDGTEKIVPREEAPVDVNASANSGPRMVFPPLNPNANPPSVASVAPNAPPPPSAGNGTLSSNQPRKIKTFSVRGDQADPAAAPAADAQTPAPKPPAAPRAMAPVQRPSAVNANASSANTPLSLMPQTAPTAPAAEPRTHLATTTPAAPSSGGGYLVQVSSQRNEADAQASYRVLQGKFPTVLGSRSPLIKRADLGEKGVYYRAMVGPFGSSEEASQFCGSLKTAGGQCVIQRN
ncbi:MAG TPA: SPOR domain-containing protein [Bradyrhizobium sp.]|jgi:hypothetical protein